MDSSGRGGREWDGGGVGRGVESIMERTWTCDFHLRGQTLLD